MKTVRKTTPSHPIKRCNLGVMLFLFSSFLVFASKTARGEDPAICDRHSEVVRTIANLDARIAEIRNKPEATRTDQEKHDLSRMESENSVNRGRADTLSMKCEDQKADIAAERRKCDSKTGNAAKYFKFNDETGECEEKEFGHKDNPESGECNNAELFRGTNWKGEACKNTANTVKDVTVRQEAVSASAQAIATTYSAMQAQQTSGFQNDAQARQQKILQALAITKIATGGMQLAGAAQLKTSAGEAEAAASSISEGHKKIAAACSTRTDVSEETCFYEVASKEGLPSDKAAYANFERMKSASTQSQEQADAANNLAKANMVTGLADTLVGLQALQMSRQAQQNAMGMGQLPQQPMIPGYRLGSGQSGGLSPGVAPGTGTQAPTDFGTPGADTGEFGVAGGGVGNGIRGGKGFAPTAAMKVEKSGVSSAGGGGGAGSLRGGGGGGGGKKSGGGRTGNTAGEYQIGGGGGAAFRGAGGPAKDEKNPFAEALAKLFPPDQNGNPVVDSRQLASEQPAEAVDESVFVGSEVYASDPTIFEQIKAKYQQLANTGRL